MGLTIFQLTTSYEVDSEGHKHIGVVTLFQLTTSYEVDLVLVLELYSAADISTHDLLRGRLRSEHFRRSRKPFQLTTSYEVD